MQTSCSAPALLPQRSAIDTTCASAFQPQRSATDMTPAPFDLFGYLQNYIFIKRFCSAIRSKTRYAFCAMRYRRYQGIHFRS